MHIDNSAAIANAKQAAEEAEDFYWEVMDTDGDDIRSVQDAIDQLDKAKREVERLESEEDDAYYWDCYADAYADYLDDFDPYPSSL